MTAEIIQDDVLHALQDFERRDELTKVQFFEPKKEEEPKEETPLFLSLNNDDKTL